jgi:hypothetical protein
MRRVKMRREEEGEGGREDKDVIREEVINEEGGGLSIQGKFKKKVCRTAPDRL